MDKLEEILSSHYEGLLNKQFFRSNNFENENNNSKCYKERGNPAIKYVCGLPTMYKKKVKTAGEFTDSLVFENLYYAIAAKFTFELNQSESGGACQLHSEKRYLANLLQEMGDFGEEKFTVDCMYFLLAVGPFDSSLRVF